MSEVGDVKPLLPAWPVPPRKRREEQRPPPADGRTRRRPPEEKPDRERDRQDSTEHVDEYA